MHQYLFFVGDFPIRAYGLILSLSIILATGVAYFLAKQDGRWHNHIVDIGIYSGIAGIVGARLWDVFFFDWAYYSHHLSEIFYVWQGGMAIQGGIVFGVGAGIIYARRHKIDILSLADIVAPAIILGQAIGRCANLLNGDALVRQLVVILVLFIQKQHLLIIRMVLNHYGLLRYGKVKLIL